MTHPARPMPDWRWSLADRVRAGYLTLTGTPVEYDLRPYLEVLARIDAIDAARLSDAELRARVEEARRLASSGENLDALLPEVSAVVREASARILAMRPFDVQVMAAVAPPSGQARRACHRRGQDARRRPAGRAERPRPPGRPRLHRQRLPRVP